MVAIGIGSVCSRSSIGECSLWKCKMQVSGGSGCGRDVWVRCVV